MRKRFLIFFALMSIALLFQNFGVPDFPSRNMDTLTIKKVNGLYQTTNNHIPMLEFTHDGRISLLRRNINGGIGVFVVKPEKVINHIQDSQNPVMGANLIDSTPDYVFRPQTYYSPSMLQTIGDGFQPMKSIICEKTEVVQNPYVCRGNRDCYDITFVTGFKKANPDTGFTSYRYTSLDVHLEVVNPKTVNAFIDPATIVVNPQSFKIGDTFQYKIMAEHVIAGDGRLLVTRTANSDVYLSDLTTLKRNINIVYSTYNTNLEQCDVRQWRNFHPISHAHYDEVNHMRDRYKFARYPLRDSLGILIPNGEEFGGSYPWIDKSASNLFFTTIGMDRFYNFDKNSNRVIIPYPERPESNNYFTLLNITDATTFHSNRTYMEELFFSRQMGFTMAGFWTHGKMVLLDGPLNNVDFPLRISDRIDPQGQRINVQRQVRLYNGAPSGQEYETIGGGREVGEGVLANEYHPFLTPNSTFIGSLENRLNYNKKVVPAAARDVVWHFGTTKHTEELIFDDYNNPFFLINADMTGAISLRSPASNIFMHYHGGFQNSVEQSSSFNGFPQKPHSVPALHGVPALVQNAATSPNEFMKVPYYGKILGSSRIEPIAKGGIYGKGLWLEPSGAVAFQIPEQPSTAQFHLGQQKEWFAGVFIDPRESTTPEVGALKDLFTFSNINVSLRKFRQGDHLFDRVAFSTGSQRWGHIVLPPGLQMNSTRWRHIGVVFLENSMPDVFIDGYYLGRANLNPDKVLSQYLIQQNLQPAQIIYLGNTPITQASGVRGWYDEFKVIARYPTDEEICNYARGTLVEIDPVYNPDLLQRANLFPTNSHSRIREQIYENNAAKKYVCFTRYYAGQHVLTPLSKEGHASLKNIPPHAKSIREKILGIQNALVYNKPRPNFSGNKFCLSCHTSQNPFPELGLDALNFIPNLKVQEDSRRQPLNPPAKLRGVIPAGYFGSGFPQSQIVTAEGVDVDKFIHPQLSTLNLSWSNLGSDYFYSLDVRDRSQSPQIVIAPCIHSGILSDRTSFAFSGQCANSAQVPLVSTSDVRICYTRNRQWGVAGQVGCSPYTPVNFHEGGELFIHLNPLP